jgi:hypothetical protein
VANQLTSFYGIRKCYRAHKRPILKPVKYRPQPDARFLENSFDYTEVSKCFPFEVSRLEFYTHFSSHVHAKLLRSCTNNTVSSEVTSSLQTTIYTSLCCRLCAFLSFLSYFSPSPKFVMRPCCRDHFRYVGVYRRRILKRILKK